MGLINYIKEQLNPEIVRQFNDLYDHHSKAIHLYCKGGYKDPNHIKWQPRRKGYPTPEKTISFQWKKKLVEEKEHILNWYREETEYTKGCAYATSHPYGLTIALRAKRIMPKDAPTPYLPEWEKSEGGAPFLPTQPLRTSYKNVPFCSITGEIYQSVDWQQVEQWETEARNLLKRIAYISKWQKEQSDFASKCNSLKKKELPDWGCYFYDVLLPTADNTDNYLAKVRQVFYTSYCSDTELDYTHFSHCSGNRQTVSSLLRMDSSFLKFVHPLLGYIGALNKDANGNLTVVLGNSEAVHSVELNKYHFRQLIDKLKDNGIPVVQYEELDTIYNSVPLKKIIVVIEVVTSNDHLKTICSRLFQKYEEESPLIVYATILKEYSSSEMRSLIDEENKKIEEAKRKKKEEEEKRRKEEEEKKRQEKELRTKRMMLATAESTNWPMVKGVHHYFFYYYYPTRFENVTAFDWNVRNLIWDFKKGTSYKRVYHILCTKLRRIYSKAMINSLTFVCIPASTYETHQKRYQSFMTDVCNATGMENGYEHITIVKEKAPTHLGGNSSAEYEYDKDFFNRRLVILFDDVVTRGDSLAKMKAELENVGAHIVAALSIGRTYSDYHGNTRKQHPWICENIDLPTLNNIKKEDDSKKSVEDDTIEEGTEA